MSCYPESMPGSSAARHRATLATLVLTGLLLTSCSTAEGPSPTDATTAAEPSTPTEAPHPSLESATDTPLMNSMMMSPARARLTLDVLSVDSDPDAGAVDPAQFPLDETATDWGWAAVGLENPECTVNNAALARDAATVDIDTDCQISSGTWVDPLTGQPITQDQTSVESFIPLQHVQETGGGAWNDEQRGIFANSPFSLLTMNSDTVAQRGDRGPNEWRPENTDLWCAYALRWVDVKNTYGLTLKSTDERTALLEMLDSCPAEMDPDQSAV